MIVRGREEFLPRLKEVDFSGKNIALFGLGNRDKYTDEFVDAMGEIYHFVVARGAKVVGQWPANDYDFISLKALVNDEFVGLVLVRRTRSCSPTKEWRSKLQMIAAEFRLAI
jgi:flavodoxin I